MIEELTIPQIVEKSGLQHIAFIMDGNRRWAKQQNMPTAVGHKKGVSSLKKVVKLANEWNIKYITVYAFSTENWKRSEEEVSFLMNLLYKTLQNEIEEMLKENVKIRIIGDLEPLDKKLRQILENSMEKSSENTGVNLQIAINYGARHEIVQAVQKIAQKIENNELKSQEITENTIEENLYTAGIPAPDLLVRTGGESRISNYLLWQIAYSEILITEKYWPEYNKEEFAKNIKEFASRSRRFGK